MLSTVSILQVLSTAFLAGHGPPKSQAVRAWMWQGKDLTSAWTDQIGEGESLTSCSSDTFLSRSGPLNLETLLLQEK